MTKKDKKKKGKDKGGSRGRKKDARSLKEKSKKKSREAKGKKEPKAPKEKRARGRKAKQLEARALTARRNGSLKVRVPEQPVAEEYEVAPYFVDSSPIHGRGLFAATFIQEDAWIGTYEGSRTRDDGTYVLWVEDGQGGLYGVRGKNELRYLNHSHEPNAEFDGEDLFAIRPIEEGAEITFDYGDEWSDVDD